MFNRDIEDFIRDDESEYHDDDFVCTCDCCGKDIRIGQDMMVFLNVNGKSARICENCIQDMSPDFLADLLGVWNFEDDASSADAALTTQTVEQKRRANE